MVAVSRMDPTQAAPERASVRERAADATSHPRSEATIYLWSISPFGYKVLLAAAHKGVPTAVRVASFPDCMAAEKRTGKRKTPFMVVGGEWISDSTTMCQWLERQPGPTLWPQGAAERAECGLLEDWADEALNRSVEPWIWMVGHGFDRMLKLCIEDQTHRPSAWLFRLLGGWLRRRW